MPFVHVYVSITWIEMLFQMEKIKKMFIESGWLIIKEKILSSSVLGLSIGPIFKCQAVQEEEDSSQQRQKHRSPEKNYNFSL